MALLAPPSGRLADRVRPQALAAVGVACILAGSAAAQRRAVEGFSDDAVADAIQKAKALLTHAVASL